MPSPLHYYADKARDVLAIWGAISLIFAIVGTLLAWRSRGKRWKEERLRREIYIYLLNFPEPKSVEEIWDWVVWQPIVAPYGKAQIETIRNTVITSIMFQWAKLTFFFVDSA